MFLILHNFQNLHQCHLFSVFKILFPEMHCLDFFHQGLNESILLVKDYDEKWFFLCIGPLVFGKGQNFPLTCIILTFNFMILEHYLLHFSCRGRNQKFFLGAVFSKENNLSLHPDPEILKLTNRFQIQTISGLTFVILAEVPAWILPSSYEFSALYLRSGHFWKKSGTLISALEIRWS